MFKQLLLQVQYNYARLIELAGVLERSGYHHARWTCLHSILGLVHWLHHVTWRREETVRLFALEWEIKLCKQQNSCIYYHYHYRSIAILCIAIASHPMCTVDPNPKTRNIQRRTKSWYLAVNLANNELLCTHAQVTNWIFITEGGLVLMLLDMRLNCHSSHV